MEEEYADIFSRPGDTNHKAITTIQAVETEKAEGIKIVVTLGDGTLTASSLPRWCCQSEDKPFIFYYVNKVLAPNLAKHDPLQQQFIDEILDRHIEDVSLHKKRLEKLARSVNWAVSVAVCKAGAYCKKTVVYKYIAELGEALGYDFHSDFILPTPSFNITNGQRLCPENRLADQHLVILPLAASSCHEAIHMIKKIYDKYFKVPTTRIAGHNAFNERDERSNTYTFSVKDIANRARSLENIIADLGYDDKVSIGVNIGASKFYMGKQTYRFNFDEENGDGSSEISSEAIYKACISLMREYNFVTLEDAFHMDDQDYSHKLAKELFPDRVIMELDSVIDFDSILGIIRAAPCTGFVLKVDQIGSVTKCLEVVLVTKPEGWVVDMSSHDSCETSEPFIADFCVGLSLDKLKIGVSCITTTSDCNICNRVRELDIERAEDDFRTFAKSATEKRMKRLFQWIRPQTNEHDSDEDESEDEAEIEESMKQYFKKRGIVGLD